MQIAEQLTALALLIDFLFGITLGVVFGAVHGSRRGVVLAPAADDSLSAGARVIYGIYTRDDDGYLHGLGADRNRVARGPREHEGRGRPGEGVAP